MKTAPKNRKEEARESQDFPGRNVAIIPARGGSKGLPRKNILPCHGKPLIAHTIASCLESRHISDTFVSSDDEAILNTAVNYGAKTITRPSHLAEDHCSSESALIHALDELELLNIRPDRIIFLQATSPLRAQGDLDRAIEQFAREKADSLLSVSPSHVFIWKMVNGKPQPINYDIQKRPRRQDMEPEYVENGSFYIIKPETLRSNNNRLGGKISMYIMRQPTVDIDDVTDLRLSEILLSSLRNS